MPSLADLRRDPNRFTADLVAGDGTPFTARLLRATDALELGSFLDGLSPAVRRVYGPHPLTSAYARSLCAGLDDAGLLPFLAWVTPGPTVVAYFLVQPGLRDGDRQRYIGHGLPLVPRQCCTLAPCVADAWQGRGLGSTLMRHVVDCLRGLGCRRLVLWGGVRSDNPQARRFYARAGFRTVGDFPAAGILNHDMVLNL